MVRNHDLCFASDNKSQDVTIPFIRNDNYNPASDIPLYVCELFS